MHRHRSKKEQRIRFILVYTIVPALAVLVTFLLVLYIIGWRFNPAQQTVSQVGLLQLDSSPRGAKVTVDGKDLSGTTATRHDTSTGQHTVTMTLSGYRAWQKTATIEAGSITWFDYALLVPDTPKTQQLESFSAQTQTLAHYKSQKIALLDSPASPKITFLTMDNADHQLNSVTIPSSIYTSGTAHKFSLVSWGKDGEKLLVKHVVDTQTEILYVNTASPADSINLTDMVGAEITAADINAANTSQVYVLASGNIRKISISDRTVSAPIAKEVASMHMSTNGDICYVTQNDADTKQRQALYFTNRSSTPRLLRTYFDSGKIALSSQIAEYDGKVFAVLRYGSTMQVSQITNDTGADGGVALSPEATIEVPDGVSDISISPTGRFIVVEYDSSFLTYDLDMGTLSTTTLKGNAPDNRGMQWLDNYHMWGDRDNMFTLYDFDGLNAQALGSVALGQAALLTDNEQYIYSFDTASDGSIHLVQTDLRVR